MNTKAVDVAGQDQLPAPVARRGITEAAWRTLANTLYPGAAPQSVLMVVDYCAARKLDPLKKPCHIVPMQVKDAKTGSYSWRDVVLPGIYEYRTTATRTGLYLGHSKPEYGEVREFCGTEAPEWCEMTVYRWSEAAKQKIEYPVRVYFRECAATKRDRSGGAVTLNDRWNRAPIQMLTKCFSADTEILTERGFMRFDALTNERVLQVTDRGLEPVVAAPFAKKYSGEMICYDSDDVNFCVTPNHDMVTTHGKIEASILFDRSRSRAKFWIPRSIRGSGDDISISDDALQLAAIYLADGSDHGLGAFVVEVSRPPKIEAIRELGLHESEGVGSQAGAVANAGTRQIVTRFTQTRFRFRLARIAPIARRGKMIDMDTLLAFSRRQARLFVDTLVEFDGSTDATTGVRRFFTSRPDHLAAFEVAAIKAGYSINKPTSRVSDISTKPNYVLTVSERDEIPVRRVGRTFHASVQTTDAQRLFHIALNDTGIVWCVTVPSGVIVVRRNGFSMLCGNCTEAAGLREAFPDEIGGEPTADEMEGRTIEVPVKANPRDGLDTAEVEPADAESLAARMRNILDADKEEDDIALAVFDLCREIETSGIEHRNELYLLAHDQLPAKLRTAWKTYRKLGEELARRPVG